MKLLKKLKRQAKPREIDEIKKELGQVLLEIGKQTYQISVYQAEVVKLNQRAVELNQEGAARMETLKAEVAQNQGAEVPNV